VTNCPKSKHEADTPEVTVQTVVGQLNDPRRKQGTRFSIVSIVLLALAALLTNHVSELAIAQWGAAQSDEVKKALGFEKGVTPHQSTLNRLFRRLSPDEVEAAFRQFFVQSFANEQEERGVWAVSIDGKAQRGRLKFEQEEAYRVHAVSVVDHQTGIVLTQGHVERTASLAGNAPTASERRSRECASADSSPDKEQARFSKEEAQADGGQSKEGAGRAENEERPGRRCPPLAAHRLAWQGVDGRCLVLSALPVFHASSDGRRLSVARQRQSASAV